MLPRAFSSRAVSSLSLVQSHISYASEAELSANVPTCNFRMMLVVFGTKKNAFDAEETNINPKGNSTVQRTSLSNRLCTGAEPRTRAAAPPRGCVNTSSMLTNICILKYMGQMAAWRMLNWDRVSACWAVMLAKKDW